MMLQIPIPIPYSSDYEKNELINHMFCPVCKLSYKKDIVLKTEIKEHGIVYQIFTLRCGNCDKIYETTFFDERQLLTIDKLKSYY